MESTIDFSECEREPLRTLGFVQSHGTLLAFGRDRRVSHVSENAQHRFGLAPQAMLQLDLSSFCARENLAEIERVLPGLREGQLAQLSWTHPSRTFEGWLHLYRGRYVLELEWCDMTDEIEPEAAKLELERFLDLASGINSIEALAQHAADAFGKLTLYDRVMIYKFHEDWSGQIIAEHRIPAAEPFLGLRYPATDIPSQARELYTRNLLRVLRDVSAPPVAILAAPGCETLDLTYAILRSMSEYHIQYLQNMHVGATLNASLMVGGRLWGLISCHHLTSKAAPAWIRNAAARIAHAVSQRMDEVQRRSVENARAKMVRQLQGLSEEVRATSNIVEALCFGKSRLNTIFQLNSIAIYADEACITIGNAPSAGWIRKFVRELLPLQQDVFCFSERWGGLRCEPCEAATGALALVLSREPATVIIGFRTELEQELTWGGDVHQAAIQVPNASRLSPRKSFAAYKQTIRGTSLAWTGIELEKAHGMLPILRSVLPPDASAALSIVRQGIQQLWDALPDPSSITGSLLDLVSEGMSLFLNSRGDSTTPAFASQTLLNQFDLDGNGPAFSLTISDFLRHIGMPDDLLNRTHFAPQEVKVMTGRCANRTYLVQLKQILEVAVNETSAFILVLTFSDMTRQARLIETTEAARKRAEHANRIKSTFLANTTHEVRTPMNGILGVAHLLKDTPLSAEQTELVEIIERSGVALLQIVNDILDFSKIEAGKLNLESVSFHLHSLLRDAVQIFRPLASQQVNLELIINPDVPAFLIGDPGRFRQIVLNLLGNAIKFTKEGQVTLRARLERNSMVYATLAFEIADTGIGMSADKAGRLFERFDQADPSISRRYGGTGLGLSISKELVTLMGGHIFASSTPGKGTTIDFRLTFLRDRPGSPDLPDAAATMQETLSLHALAEASENRRSGSETNIKGPIKVLLVDDNAVNLKVANAMLTRDLCLVTMAWNGADAVELAKQDDYDVILMDCQMPEMDGYEASAFIRKSEAGRKRTPIVALTASMMADEQDRCFSAGMDEIMLKPVEAKKLRTLIRKWAMRPDGILPALPLKTPFSD